MRLSEVTTFRLGGPAKRWFDCATPSDLKRSVKESAGDFLLIGGGSNLLVSDEGVDMTVIRYAAERPDIRVDGTDVMVSGATSLDDLARRTAEMGLAGLTCCTGIPGTVGGAVAGNAGAFGEQIGDRVVSVQLIDRSGAEHEVDVAALGFAYRTSRLQASTEIVSSVRLALTRGDASQLMKQREEVLALRASKHPDWRTTPTAGSFFKNIEPTSKAGRRQAAGWFLEQAGAKDFRVGGARLFEKHANIIIGGPGCTASDVYALSRKMAESVRTMFGLELHREVRLIGRFDI